MEEMAGIMTWAWLTAWAYVAAAAALGVVLALRWARG